MKRSLISLLLLCFACDSSYARPIASTATIDIYVARPLDGAPAGNNLHAIVTIVSTFEIKRVRARVEGREVELTFSDTALCDRSGCLRGWVGDISLSGLPRGPKTLTVVATDVFGNTSQAQRAFVYDRPPTLTVNAPLDETVARPAIFVDATCADDDPAGCASVMVGFDVEGPALAAGKDAVKESVSIPTPNGETSVVLYFTARDSIGQTVTLTRRVYVEASNNLSEVASVGGHIFDVRPDRILFLEGRTLKIRDRSSGLDTVVINDPVIEVSYGFLSPKGAIFVAYTVNELRFRLYDWRDGDLVGLGLLDSSSSLKVKGKYAIWNVFSPNVASPNGAYSLVLRDLDSGINAQVSTIAGNISNDVSASGDVAYWSADSSTKYNIYRYRAGGSVKLTNDTALWNTYPLTDGINVVYRKSTPCCGGNQTYAIMLYRPSGEVTLSPPSRQELRPDFDYRVNGGWVAFTRLSATGLRQVWTRSPADEEAQVSFFNTSSFIKALSPLGGVVFSNSRTYLKEPGMPEFQTGSGLGDYFWQDGQWFVTIGRSLFKVNATLAPEPTLLTEPGSQQAVALNAVTWARGPFSTVTTPNFSPDQRTRLMLLAANVSVEAGDDAATVLAQAEDSQHRLYSLPVEYVGKVTNFDWLTQINVVLPDELRGAGDVWVSINVRGVISNRAMVNIQ